MSSVTPSSSSLSRKGDYYRYLAEFKSGNDRKEAADQSLKAYEVLPFYCLLPDFRLCTSFLVDYFLARSNICTMFLLWLSDLEY